jgi:hypothetical protein
MTDIPRESLLRYIQSLEATNEQLLKSLKQCVALLSYVPSEIANKEEWQTMLDHFDRLIEAYDSIKRPEPPMVGGN